MCETEGDEGRAARQTQQGWRVGRDLRGRYNRQDVPVGPVGWYEVKRGRRAGKEIN